MPFQISPIKRISTTDVGWLFKSTGLFLDNFQENKQFHLVCFKSIRHILIGLLRNISYFFLDQPHINK